MKRIFSLISIAVACVAFGGFAAESPRNYESDGEGEWNYCGFIEPETEWEVEVTDLSNPDSQVMTVFQKLSGFEEINGKEYMKLWVKVDDGEYSLASYIRVDLWAVIYALSPEDLERGECLIYDFNKLRSGEVTPINWDGTLSQESYKYNFGKTYQLWESCGIPYTAHEAVLYSSDDDNCDNPLGSVTWIRGIGSPAGFLNQCYALNSSVKTELIKVNTVCTGVVYEKTPAGITSVEESVISNNIKYRPDGTVFNDGDKGLYIMNGRKYIQR